MKVDLNKAAIIKMVKWNGIMEMFMKATGKRIECKEEAFLNIMMDLYSKVLSKLISLLIKVMFLEIPK